MVSYYHKNKERLLPIQRQRYYTQKALDPVHVIFIRLRSRSKKSGLPFDIEESDICIPDKCPILDIPIFHTEGKHTDNSPSVDRIDNTKGYVKGNVRVISYKANMRKGDMSAEDIKRMYEYVSNS